MISILVPPTLSLFCATQSFTALSMVSPRRAKTPE